MSNQPSPLNPFFRIVAGAAGLAIAVVSVLRLWDGPSHLTAWSEPIAGVIIGAFFLHVGITGRNYDWQRGIS